MAIPKKFRDLANAVRNEIYGKDVREAIAKSIEESGASSETAIKITEQLIDGSFDEAELTTEIERRLNALEDEYAPQLSGIEQEIEQIGTTTITRTDGLLVSQIITPTATINFTRDDKNVVVQLEEVKDDKTILTKYIRDDNGVVQRIDREVE